MKSLFVKLFIAFLLAMLISGAVFFSFAFRVKDWLLEQQHPEISRQMQREGMPPPSGFIPKRPPPDGRRMGPPGGPRGPLPPPPMLVDISIQALIFLIVGGGICYLLAWRMSAPVRRLRRAVQQLANGDLTARTGIAGSRQSDEISELGADFDRMAERIETLVSSQKQLVRDISHELRSPLARLQVALGLARKKASADAASALDRIEQETGRLNSMIGELLTLSLLENGTALTQVEPVDLGELLAEVVEDADYEAVESRQQVLLTAETAVVVSGNRELLRRAFENVVRNGMRYTGTGTAVVVRLEQNLQKQAVVQVCDHGPGVPDGLLEAIFQPFFRVEEARDRQSGGTGIGLAITARAVALHGGSVAACNRPEGGLEVEIRLPMGDIPV